MLKVEEIDKLAELARLDIPKAEKEGLGREIDSILVYVSEVQKVSGGEVKKEAGEIRNVFRKDESPHLAGEFSKELIEEAPRRQGDYIKVKRIL
jgi:aspartyl-tRNA(Asn)/glutamyl-tRNA(Gln) amidotransferase subunit C